MGQVLLGALMLDARQVLAALRRWRSGTRTVRPWSGSWPNTCVG